MCKRMCNRRRNSCWLWCKRAINRGWWLTCGPKKGVRSEGCISTFWWKSNFSSSMKRKTKLSSRLSLSWWTLMKTNENTSPNIISKCLWASSLVSKRNGSNAITRIRNRPLYRSSSLKPSWKKRKSSQVQIVSMWKILRNKIWFKRWRDPKQSDLLRNRTGPRCFCLTRPPLQVCSTYPKELKIRWKMISSNKSHLDSSVIYSSLNQIASRSKRSPWHPLWLSRRRVVLVCKRQGLCRRRRGQTQWRTLWAPRFRGSQCR